MRTTQNIRLLLALAPLLLAGCKDAEDTDAPVVDSDTDTEPPVWTGACPEDAPPTDTVPSFCGEVPKNLIFLSIDTFRKPYLGRYGQMGLTPFLDGLVEQGFVLDDHSQCSNWTFASTTCTLLGRYNLEAGFVAKLGEDLRMPLPAGTPTLASWLGEAGFYSILVSANSWLGSDWANDQGYDVSVSGGPRIPGVMVKTFEQLNAAEASGLVTDGLFLHMHVLDPHSPYNPPDEYLVGYDELEPLPWDMKTFAGHYDAIAEWPIMTPETQALVAEHLKVLYAGEIAYTDQLLSEAWAEMDALGLLDDALVVVWTDHGEAFWEHGDGTHAHMLYGNENDGVAFFWSKNMVPGSWSEPTSAIDIVPTVLSLYDVPMPPEVSGIPVGQAPPDRAIYGASFARKGVVQSVRRGTDRLQLRWGTSDVVLSDLAADPQELENHYDPAAPSDTALGLWNDLLPMIEALQPLVPERIVNWPAELPTSTTPGPGAAEGGRTEATPAQTGTH